MDPIPNQDQEESDKDNKTDPELERIEGDNIYSWSENVYFKFDSLVMASQLFIENLPVEIEMDPIPNQDQEESDKDNKTDPELERIEGDNIYSWSENVYFKFDSLVMASQLFHVSLRTFREDYIKGKNQKRSYLLPIFAFFLI